MITDFNINTLVRANIKDLQPYSSARDEYKDASSKEMIFLDANENPFENGVNRYPDPQQHAVKALLSAMKNVETGNILLGNGSDEVLDLLFRAFCEPNVDNVITLPPTYGMYAVLANINAIAIGHLDIKKNQIRIGTAKRIVKVSNNTHLENIIKSLNHKLLPPSGAKIGITINNEQTRRRRCFFTTAWGQHLHSLSQLNTSMSYSYYVNIPDTPKKRSLFYRCLYMS